MCIKDRGGWFSRSFVSIGSWFLIQFLGSEPKIYRFRVQNQKFIEKVHFTWFWGTSSLTLSLSYSTWTLQKNPTFYVSKSFLKSPYRLLCPRLTSLEGYHLTPRNTCCFIYHYLILGTLFTPIQVWLYLLPCIFIGSLFLFEN